MNLSRLVRTATFRFAALYVAVFVASLVVVGGLAYLTVHHALERQLEANVEAEAATLAAAYRAGGIDQVRSILNNRNRVESWQFRYSVTSRDNKSLIGSLTLSGTRIGWMQVNGPDRTGLAPSDIKALTIALDDRHRLSVASSAIVLRDVERILYEVIGAMLAASILLGLGGGLLVSTRFLGRVDRIAATARSIMDGDLQKRIPVQSTDDELDRLAKTLNDMLDRMHELMESLRQVSNNIAHDLRTPLSRLRQRLDLALDSDLSPVDLRSTLEAAIIDTDSILDTFSALLRIAQIEAGTRKSAFREIDFTDVVANVIEAYAPAIEDQDKELEIDISGGALLVGDRELLTQLVANLLENASRHTPEKTLIRVSLTREAEVLNLQVSDNGPGVPAAAQEKLFDRFYRADESRGTPGSGLGLSLAKAVTDLHGGSIAVRDNDPGLVVEVRLPATER